MPHFRRVVFFNLLILFFAMESVKAQAREWPNTIVYEIFVRSFQDSNGDGHGDINGITGQLDYLRTLGVNRLQSD